MLLVITYYTFNVFRCINTINTYNCTTFHQFKSLYTRYFEVSIFLHNLLSIENNIFDRQIVIFYNFLLVHFLKKFLWFNRQHPFFGLYL